MKTPNLRFKEFSDEWETSQFGDYLKSISSGKSIVRHASIGEYVFYGSTGKIGHTDRAEYTGKKILIARVGANAGSIYYVDGQYAVSDNTLVVDLLSNLNINFIFYYLKRYNLKRMVFGTGQPLVTGGQIKKLTVTLPKNSEQQKVAEFLTGVDERIKLHDKKIKLLQKYKRGIMQKIFSQQIRFKDENGRDYSDWQEKKLSEVSTIVKGQQRNKDTLTNYSKYPVINGGISPSGFTDDWNEEANTITVSEGGNSCGYVNLIKSKFWSGGHCYSLLVEKNVNNFFLYQYLKYTQLEIMRLRVGSGLPNIQKNDIYKLKLYLPVEEEQQKIAEFLTSFDDRIELERSYLEQAKQFKKALLQRMFV